MATFVPLDEEEMQQIYNWVDEIPLSRPKRNIGRDFADGGMFYCTNCLKAALFFFGCFKFSFLNSNI